MASIFGEASASEYQGAFRTTAASSITFNNKDLTLLQNLQVSHQQPVQPLFEIGSNKRYYVVGKASGTFSCGSILGFGSSALDQVVALADPCVGDSTLELHMPDSFCVAGAGASSGGLFLTLKGVLLQSVGFTMAAQDNLINSQLQGLITDLEYTPD